jgi:hypothetical protein
MDAPFASAGCRDAGVRRTDDDEEDEWVFVTTDARVDVRADARADAADAREDDASAPRRASVDASSAIHADVDDGEDAREDDVSETSDVSETVESTSVESESETAIRRVEDVAGAPEDGFVDEAVRRIRERLVDAIAACRRAIDAGAAAIETSLRRVRRLIDTMTRRWKDRSVLPRDVGVDIVCVTTAAGVIFLVHKKFFRFDDGVFRRKDVASPGVFDRGVSRRSRDVDFGRYFRDRSL